MTYSTPFVTPLDLSSAAASCCSPVVTVNIGGKIVFSDCNLPLR